MGTRNTVQTKGKPVKTQELVRIHGPQHRKYIKFRDGPGVQDPQGTDKYKISGFEQISKKSKKSLSKAITRNSNFSVARECKDPPGGGAKPPPLGDHLLSLSNTREIRNSSDRLVWIFWIFWKSVQNRNRRNRKPEKPKPRF